MVVDTSALLAIYFAERDSGQFEAAILQAPTAVISVGTLLEAAIVVEARHGKAGAVELDRLLKKLAVSTIAVDAEQLEAARLGCWRSGKGRHPAGLNYGELFAYAPATTSVEPLLFRGDDFSQTDVVNALGER
jgi:ribonuclease VapC